MAYFKWYRKISADLRNEIRVCNESENSPKENDIFPTDSDCKHSGDSSNHDQISIDTDTDSSVPDSSTCDIDISCHDNGSANYEFDGSYDEQPLSSESEYVSDSDCNENLSKHLAAWATKHNCTRSCVNDLLSILRISGHHDLPKDSRTLLQTPQNVVSEKKCSGDYLYFGIEANVKKYLESCVGYDKDIKLDVNIDGLPLFKSSRLQMWPILGSFDDSGVFIIALYSGSSKPKPLESYVYDFVQEVKDLQCNGVVYNGVIHNFSIRAFICDAPARSFLKGTVGHTGYFSCERCKIKGSWQNRVVFNDNLIYQPRDTLEFNQNNYDDHQLFLTPLVQLEISCITSFVLDYMHLVCLGVVKRLLSFLKKGPRCCKLSNNMIDGISKSLLSFRGAMPCEFARQPRSLDDLEYWKATEFRQFLLYTGPLALKHIVSPDVYEHFLTLHVTMSILLNSNDEIRAHYLEFAKNLLQFFVSTSSRIYGETFNVYNVHCLTHIHDDVTNMNCSLNDISAFKYENYMQTLKKLVRNSNNTIVQVAKRISELNITRKYEVANNNYKLSLRLRDSCFQLNSNKYCFIKELLTDGKYRCSVFQKKHLENLYEKPILSKDLSIGCIKNIEKLPVVEKIVQKSEFIKKICVLPWKNGYVCFPLLHEIEINKY